MGAFPAGFPANRKQEDYLGTSPAESTNESTYMSDGFCLFFSKHSGLLKLDEKSET
jgi:hypothetical protein